MANVTIKGIAEFEKKLQQAGTAARGIGKAALYDGAAVAIEAYKGALNAIKTEPFHYVKDGKRRLASPEEKAAVLSGTYGIARMRGNGDSVDTIIGVKPSEGYTTLMGKKVPTVVILRSIQSGTSFMYQQPVLRSAINKAKGAILKAMEATASDRINKIFK